ncbi:bifunctional diaminohydroxyphosphoribosylaminopyrimidine deaminase/5-amino-6-(5-phosphoribosylamino)uracil reductase RibD [Telmatospirillum sp.]|uniref:bifunctional diaminohydroxyphosphoribosylaminopyrimidine deaminase/5-amino-6-(5-phosphoribosylamino)uracil reductase RibD n=1 Tax=Telmatospirillum sp. TaxID=2079197 RepID=UPI00284E7508|nr:bifunctional diaminohydroxyphosphoribosylaminopyrimidine deaminase/5-amino-6-(5-phosphoribosylamino)uracil reductase RibD [Telmatospirillum sp.]MDR3440828.1 bifunctional diaminohydroxyphosphoribosylaminopyrimidine deaminase/5-amino-6-(5-phosphoribosylamino)uracil reductase RibD [Telmatospirillum sp.]
MQAALGLARRGLGSVWPNPSVGCVLVKDGRVVGRGWTAKGGRPHAETVALAQAGAEARGATAYVTLEPCSHYGKTGPCADALIVAGVSRVVAALEDPDPRVSGRGLARLANAGIDVEVGVCSEAAAEANAGFFKRVLHGRPLVTWKVASSLDGRIATHTGESQWITGPLSRAAGHRLRAENDAILVGSGTALVDNPELTCRLPGLADRSPIRVVVDGYLRLPLTAKLVATAKERPTWILTRNDNDPERVEAFAACGVEIIEVPLAPGGKIDLAASLQELGQRGLTRLLVEGGAHLTAALFRQALVDRVAWFRAPLLLGGDAVPAAISFGVDSLKQAPRFSRLSIADLGGDLFEYFTRD